MVVGGELRVWGELREGGELKLIFSEQERIRKKPTVQYCGIIAIVIYFYLICPLGFTHAHAVMLKNLEYVN